MTMFFGAEAIAQGRWPRIVDLATYDSAGGEFQLDVDPSSLSGGGKARYRLSQRGSTVWEGEKPFTLSDAQVTQSGVVVGYSYSKGLWVAANSEVHLVILNPDGSVRLDERIPRHHGAPDALPEPYVLGAQVDLDGDRVIFRLGSGLVEEVWRIYELSSGRFRSKVKRPPARSPAGREDARHSRILPTPPAPTEQVRPWLLRNLGTIQLGGSGAGGSAPAGPRPAASPRRVDTASDPGFGAVADWVLDPADNVYAVDVRTDLIHIFNRLGTPLRVVAVPGRSVFGAGLSIAGDGAVLVRLDRTSSDNAFLQLSVAGKLSPARQIAAGIICPNLATGGSWGVDGAGITELRRDFTVVKRFLRRLDGRWLWGIGHAVAGLDGSLAVASIDSDEAKVWELNVFSADGTAQKSFRMPKDADASTFAYDGRRLVYWQGGAIRIRTLPDGRVFDFLPEDLRAFSILPMKIAAGGRELWMLDPMRWLVLRFELP